VIPKVCSTDIMYLEKKVHLNNSYYGIILLKNIGLINIAVPRNMKLLPEGTVMVVKVWEPLL